MYVMEHHAFDKRKYMPWQVCRHCGLVLLNNDFTCWMVKRGCNAVDHPEFAAARIRYTAMKHAWWR